MKINSLTRQFLASPHYKDPDKKRLAIILNLILKASLFLGIFIFAGLWFIAQYEPTVDLPRSGLFVIANIIVTITLFGLMRRGYLQLTAQILVGYIFLILTLAALSFGGLQSVALSGYYVLVAITGLLLGGNAAFVIAVLVVAIMSALFWLQIQGFIALAPIYPLASERFLVNGANLILTGILLRLAMNNLNRALTHTRRAEQALRQANETLETKVSARTAELVTLNEQLQQEITERAQVEQALRASEERHRSILENMEEGYYELDLAGRHTFFNNALCKIYGLSPEELKNIAYKETQSKETAQDIYAIFNNVYNTGQSIKSIRFEIMRAGQPRIVEASIALMKDDQGQPFGFKGIVRDVTNRQHMERALQERERIAHLFQQQLQALHHISIELSTVDTFEQLCRQAVKFGLERLKFSRIGIWLLDLADPRYRIGSFGTDDKGNLIDERGMRHLITDDMAEVFSGRHAIKYWTDVPLYNYDGAQVGRGWNAQAAIWDGDRVIGILVVDNLLSQQPIPEYQLETLTLYGATLGHLFTRKRTEQALQDYAAELERSNKELEEFAYVASHDLQEPLRKIQTFGDRLASRYEDALDGQGRDYLARMQSASARMQQFIEDLLAYSRVNTRGQPFEVVDLNDVVKAVVYDLELVIQETGAEITIDDLPQIQADSTQMRQLFQNLISNALKFREANNTPVISIKSEEMGNNGNDYCLITVTDNGIGFDEQYLDRIFAVFQRLHSRSDYAGTGVGLAICRKIAQRHHGTITAQSKPGQGATFLITLPLKQPKLIEDNI